MKKIINKKSLKGTLAVMLCAVMAFSVCACDFDSDTKPTKTDAQIQFDKYCDDLFSEELEDDALTAHFDISNPSDYGLKYDEEDYTLGHVSDEDTKESFDELKEAKTDLEEFDRSGLTPSQKQTYDTLESYFEIQLSYEGTTELQSIFAPQSGIVANLFTTLSEFTFYEKDDTDLYLAVLKDTKRYMDECIEFTRKQAEDGYFMAEDIAQQSIDECEKHIKNDKSVLVDEFESRIKSLGLSDSEKKTVVETNKKYFEEYYIPALKSANSALESLKKSGKNEEGLCGYGKIGKKYYSAIVKDKTSSSMTPEELKSYLTNSFTKVGMSMSNVSQDDLSKFQDYKPDFKDADEVLEFLIENIEEDFPTPVTTSYTADYMSDSAKSDNVGAYYVQGRIDDTSVNIIKINPDFAKKGMTQMYTTLAHEGYPGHLYQVTASNANKDIPNVRKILSFMGATEGWAQYASKCTLDYLDTSDGIKKLIYANDILGYILYSMVDVGVNYNGWDYEKVKEYMSTALGSADDESVTAATKEAYDLARSNPGYFLPYTVGYLKMIDMRETAESELGSSFDAKEYHTFIMNLGITSIDVYEKALDMWLESKK